MRIPRLIPVESSAIKAVGYDERELVLFVRFVTDKLYAYLEVSPDTYEQFLDAASKGQFFNDYVRDHYTYLDVTED